MTVTDLLKQRIEASPIVTPTLSSTLVVSFIRGTASLLLLTRSFSGRKVCPTVKLVSLPVNSCCGSLLDLAHSCLESTCGLSSRLKSSVPAS